MLRALYYVAAFPEWLRCAEILEDECGWTPCYFSVLETNRVSVAEALPEALVHDKFQAMRAIPPEGHEQWSHASIGADVFERFSPYYPIFMRMLDRLDMSGSFTFEERNRQFYRHLVMWWNAITELEPDVAVFSNAPHGPADYMMYAVCRMRGIATLIYSKTAVSCLGFIRERIEDDPRGLDVVLREFAGDTERAIELALDPAIREQLGRLSSDYADAEPWYMKAQRTQSGAYSRKRRSLVTTGNLARAIRALPRVALWPEYAARVTARVQSRRTFVPFLARPLKIAGLPHEESSISRGQWDTYRRKSRAVKRRLSLAYSSRCEVPDLAKPYVYVPLHYQPEATTCPEAGVYVDQRLLVRVLAAAVPEGWRLLVREHPSQFSEALLGEQGRTEQFYVDLQAIPGVTLVDLSVAPFELIDNCAAVATATGTPGWEAIARGIPALVFGNAWYRACPGAFAIRSVGDAESAFRAIADGFRPQKSQVLAFIAALAQVGFHGDINRTSEPAFAMEVEDNARGLADGAMRFCGLTPNANGGSE